jgi:hypothetical protein
MHHALVIVFVFGVCRSACGLENGLAQAPLMGYSTWNGFGCEISEDKVKQVVNRLQVSGLGDLGYKYVNIDDCWMTSARSETGELQASIQFPSGMRAMGGYLHERGFKFGLYTSRGSKTCQGKVGSLGHEYADAVTFANWGVDFIKNDGCFDNECSNSQLDSNAGHCDAENRRSVLDRYRKMRNALNSTGRDIAYEVCGWEPWYAPVGAELANMFRISADVTTWGDVYQSTQLMQQLGRHSKPGGWAHPDMLIGSSKNAFFRLTQLQSRAQFTLWAIYPAPLILGLNIIDMNNWDRATYTNKEILAINQDALLLPATVVFENCDTYPRIEISSDGFSNFSVEGCHSTTFLKRRPKYCHGIYSGRPFRLDSAQPQGQCQQVWAKELEGGEVALAAVNFADVEASISLPLSDILQEETLDIISKRNASIRVHSIWNETDDDIDVASLVTFALPASGGNAMYRLSVVDG